MRSSPATGPRRFGRARRPTRPRPLPAPARSTPWPIRASPPPSCTPWPPPPAARRGASARTGRHPTRRAAAAAPPAGRRAPGRGAGAVRARRPVADTAARPRRESPAVRRCRHAAAGRRAPAHQMPARSRRPRRRQPVPALRLVTRPHLVGWRDPGAGRTRPFRPPPAGPAASSTRPSWPSRGRRRREGTGGFRAGRVVLPARGTSPCRPEACVLAWNLPGGARRGPDRRRVPFTEFDRAAPAVDDLVGPEGGEHGG